MPVRECRLVGGGPTKPAQRTQSASAEEIEDFPVQLAQGTPAALTQYEVFEGIEVPQLTPRTKPLSTLHCDYPGYLGLAHGDSDGCSKEDSAGGDWVGRYGDYVGSSDSGAHASSICSHGTEMKARSFGLYRQPPTINCPGRIDSISASEADLCRLLRRERRLPTRRQLQSGISYVPVVAC